jgi:hypothetical protein
MTEGRQTVRVLLYGCVHKPRFSAFSCPKVGDTITCFMCRRGRDVVGIETGWAKAGAECSGCKWSCSNTGAKKRLFALAHRHADGLGHRVKVINDGHVTVVRPRTGSQLLLIDDLMLPD